MARSGAREAGEQEERHMPRVAIDVLLKRELLDPQGRATERALPGLGLDGVSDVRIGKHLELDVDAEGDALAARVEEMCAGFLTNPVVETYCWRVIEEHERADAGTGASLAH